MSRVSPRRRVIAGGVLFFAVIAFAVVLMKPGKHEGGDGQEKVESPSARAREPLESAPLKSSQAAKPLSRPARLTVAKPLPGPQDTVKAGTGSAVPGDQASEDDYLDEIDINLRLATLEVEMQMKDRRGEWLDAWRVRERMERLRSRLPRDAQAGASAAQDANDLSD